MTDDLISRQGMCDSLDKYRIEKMLEGKDVSLVWECIDKVLQEPSAQPERKTGKWINSRKCSECGYVDVISPYAHNVNTGEVTLVYKFCPNCGARME